MENSTLTQADLAHFTGSMGFISHGSFRRPVYTEGVQYIAERAGAYWLLDLISSHIAFGKLRRKLAEGDMVELRLVGNKTGNGCKVQAVFADPMTGENMEPVCVQSIPFSDFPFDGFENRTLRLWLAYGNERFTLYLPSEH